MISLNSGLLSGPEWAYIVAVPILGSQVPGRSQQQRNLCKCPWRGFHSWVIDLEGLARGEITGAGSEKNGEVLISREREDKKKDLVLHICHMLGNAGGLIYVTRC